jgi:GNAT superfamily N-acetyltransferase
MADAMDIATVHVESWRATYRGLLPQDFLDELDPVQRCAVWRRIMSGQGPRERTVLAEEAGQVIGFANVCPSRDSDATSGTVGELASIYLLSSLWGQGFGRQLMAGAISALVEDEFSEATLWVLEGNERARRFYQAGGWTSDGTVKQDTIRGFVVHEARYRLALR